jgi:hypothetical protein
MAPAAAALMQAIRAHRQAGNELRAGTLALQLSLQYTGEPAAAQYAEQVLQELQPKYVRVDVSCEGCNVDLDGTLQEYLLFFVEPEITHTVVAHFETGDVDDEVSGVAGESRMLLFEAPEPPPGVDPTLGGTGSTGSDQTIIGIGDEPEIDSTKPLPPLATIIGASVTAALGGATLGFWLWAKAGVDEYEKKAAEANDPNLDAETRAAAKDKAQELLDSGQTKDLLTTTFLIATGVAAASTGVIAIFFTDWSGGGDEDSDSFSGAIVPIPNGGMATVNLQF